MKSVLGWHFVRSTGRLSHGDERVVAVGKTLTVEGRIQVCVSGLHASKNAGDAYCFYSWGVSPKEWKSGAKACRVLSWGFLKGDRQKHVARNRTVIAMLSARATQKILASWKKRWGRHPYYTREASADLSRRLLKAMGITARTRKAKT